MAAYLQWRRFAFFDRDVLTEPDGKPVLLPPGITVCDSGRGSLVFGDILAVSGVAGGGQGASERVWSALFPSTSLPGQGFCLGQRT